MSEAMKKVRKDAWLWSFISCLWIFLFTLGIIDEMNSYIMMGMILVPIAMFNAAKKWIMVRKGWET